jgi:glutamate carboxypeptidase
MTGWLSPSPVGYSAHSNDAEYVRLETIAPRLYLSARTIMDVAQDKVK